MTLKSYVTATDLAEWAGHLEARAALPEIILKLIFATINSIKRVHIRFGEGLNLPGYDGILECDNGNAFVPTGISCWEMSCDKKIEIKASKDYQNRSANPDVMLPSQCTFIFVTLRRWPGKEKWRNEKQSEGIWREVRAYDADDLEAWLTLAPAVHGHFSVRIGTHTSEAIDLKSWWDNWSSETEPKISAVFLRAGRTETIDAIKNWFDGASNTIALQAESSGEAIATFGAIVKQFPEIKQLEVFSRTIVVNDLVAWEHLSLSKNRLILIPTFNVQNNLGVALANAHRVLIPLGMGDAPAPGTLRLPKLDRGEILKVLLDQGIPEQKANRLVVVARHSLRAFRRETAVRPELHTPRWFKGDMGGLIPFVLAGSWTDGSQGDQYGIEILTARAYSAVIDVSRAWLNREDSPVRCIGDVWLINDRRDTWDLTRNVLRREDLERFETLALAIFASPDGKLELINEERFLERNAGLAVHYSDRLCEGVATTLAIMGSSVGPFAIGYDSPSEYSGRMIKKILGRANVSWQAWASLSFVLPLFAEAAPDEFLESVEQVVAERENVMRELFLAAGEGLFATNPHVGLLWAIERISWSPVHFARAVLCLGGLARLDPGGRLSNRPKNSLREIFIFWRPHANFSLEMRFQALDRLRKSEPAVAWELLVSLLPTMHDTASSVDKPHWRDWADGQVSIDVPVREYLNAVQELCSRVREDLLADPNRWCGVLESFGSLPDYELEQMLLGLEALDVNTLGSTTRASIFDGLRGVISHHRCYPEAKWAMPRKCTDRLEAVYVRMQPTNLVERYRWLFSRTPRLLDGDNDWEYQTRVLAQRRVQAIEHVYEQAGFSGLLDLVAGVELPFQIGNVVGQVDILSRADQQTIWDQYLASELVMLKEFAGGFIMGQLSSKGRDVIENQVDRLTLSPRQRVEILFCLPPDPRTWKISEALGEEIDQLYWTRYVQFTVDEDSYEFVVKKLVHFRRPFVALEILCDRIRKKKVVPEATLLRCLESIGPETEEYSFTGLSASLSEAFAFLESSDLIEEERLVELELVLLPRFAYRDSPPSMLQRRLAKDSSFFVKMVSLAYKVDDESDLGRDPRFSRAAYRLLEPGHHLPGLIEGNSIDEEFLSEWIRNSRQAVAGTDQVALVDQIIGRFLSSYPALPDDIWPQGAICEVIENVWSVDIELGFRIGLFNRRGVVVKASLEDGQQERKLQERYTGFAETLGGNFPRVSAMLRKIAQYYGRTANQEDLSAEWRDYRWNLL